MGLSTLLVELVSTLRKKLWEVVMKYKNFMFFSFQNFFLKMYILEVATFSLV